MLHDFAIVVVFFNKKKRICGKEDISTVNSLSLLSARIKILMLEYASQMIIKWEHWYFQSCLSRNSINVFLLFIRFDKSVSKLYLKIGLRLAYFLYFKSSWSVNNSLFLKRKVQKPFVLTSWGLKRYFENQSRNFSISSIDISSFFELLRSKISISNLIWSWLDISLKALACGQRLNAFQSYFPRGTFEGTDGMFVVWVGLTFGFYEHICMKWDKY